MKDKTDKEKSITPIESLFEWIKELIPGDDLNEYVNISICQPGGKTDFGMGIEGYTFTFYSHTYKYILNISADKMILTSINRKPIAGTEGIGNEQIHEGRQIYNGVFADDSWRELKDVIIKREVVKIVKYARDDMLYTTEKSVDIEEGYNLNMVEEIDATVFNQ